MKTIHTVIRDIYELLNSDRVVLTEEICERLGVDISRSVLGSINPREERKTLRLSKMGEHCPCALWYSVNRPELAEKLQPWVKIKFAYGNILEALVIALVKAAGHEVLGEQDAVTLDGVVGHRDCVIDGCVVDVKSINSLGFLTVKSGRVPQDTFLRDYLDQLDGYTLASAGEDIVTVKDKAYLLVIDKTLGHLALYEHKIRPDHIIDRIRAHKQIVGSLDPRPCTCGTVADGKSGNIRLDTKASYNPYKYCCNPRLRTFIYADGPRYLTTVRRKPDVLEVDKYGKPVYIS